MKRNVLLLSICQALMMSANSLIVTSSALVGLSLASNPAWSTVPVAVMFAGTLSCTFSASILMKHLGRRLGFAIGLMAAIAGAITSSIAIVSGSFVGFCFGALLIGVFNAVGQYYRFAAADVASLEFRSRAISYVMAGGVVAAFVGPNLASATREIVDSAEFAGSYAVLVVLYAASLLAVALARIPTPTAHERSETGRTLRQIAAQPTFVVAVIGATMAYGIMNLLMTATPLAMEHHGHLFGDTALAIQWHVLGMFAPSFVTGHLIRRFGEVNIMLIGAALLGGCIAVNLAGTSVAHFWLALLCLGVGWNFLFIGSTTLLTSVYDPSEKAKTQGLNDLIVFSTVGVTALSSGYLHHRFGWETLNQVVIPLVAIAIVAALWLRRSRARAGIT